MRDCGQGAASEGALTRDMGESGAGSPLFLCLKRLNSVILPKGVAGRMIGLRKIDSGALAEEVRSMGRARPLAEAAERKVAEAKGAKAGARFGGRRLREGLKVVSGFDSYSPWSGAEGTYRRIADAGKLGELEDWLEEMYPDGIGETELNDLLWFDADEVLSAMGLSDEEEDEDGEEEEDEEDEDMGESLASVTAAAEAPTVNGKASEGISEGISEMDFAVSGNGFEPSSEDDDVGSFVGF